MKRILLLAIICLSLGTPISSSEPGPGTSDNNASAISLLDEAYSRSGELNELDRLRFWNNLIIETPAIAPDRVRLWAGTLISDVRNSSNPKLLAWDKVAYQKNAIVALSKIDPRAAMEAFSQIGPAQLKHNHMPEDVRAFGARTIFFNYWQALGVGSLPRIRTEAINLAQTQGAYPFHAISLILADLGSHGQAEKKQTNEIFSEALSYYQCGSKVENQDDDFLTFLQNTKSVIDKPLFRTAVRSLVAHLMDPKCDARPKGDEFVGVLQTSQGAIRLTDHNKLRLFQAFGLISYADSTLAADIRSKNPEMEKADATVERVIGSYVNAELSPTKKAQMQKTGLQQALSRAVQMQRQTNPQAALQLARLLDDSDSQFIQVASVLPQLARSDLDQAKQLYAQELNEFDSFGDPNQRLMATVWIAEAAHATEDIGNFQYLANALYENAVQLFESSYEKDKDSMIEDRPGYEELSELIEFGAAHNVSWLLDESKQMPDPRLKAYLLMHAAKGLMHREPPMAAGLR
jgi:hypothetical protein